MQRREHVHIAQFQNTILFFFWCFLGPDRRHMVVPSLGIKSELWPRPQPQPPWMRAASATYTTAHTTAHSNAGSLTHWVTPEIGLRPHGCSSHSFPLSQEGNSRSTTLEWEIRKERGLGNWKGSRRIRSVEVVVKVSIPLGLGEGRSLSWGGADAGGGACAGRTRRCSTPNVGARSKLRRGLL